MVNLTEWLHGQDLRGGGSSRRSGKLAPLTGGGSGSVVSEEWCSFSDDESDGTVNTDDEWEKEDGGEEEDITWDDDFDGLSPFKDKGEDEEDEGEGEDEEEGGKNGCPISVPSFSPALQSLRIIPTPFFGPLLSPASLVWRQQR